MTNEQEYVTLREEIVNNINIQNTYLIAMYTIVVTIIVFALEQKNEILLLLPYIILFPFQSIINAKRNGMIKMSAYINVFLENNHGWEAANIKISAKINNKAYSEKGRIIYGLDRFIRRMGATQLGILCSCCACVLHFYNLHIKINQIMSIPAYQWLIFIAAFVLGILTIWVNKTVWSYPLQSEVYNQIMQEVQSELQINKNAIDMF